MRLLIDMNLSPKWALFLADHQFQAVHWSTVGSLNAGDGDLMAYALNEDYVILTHDLDFGSILAAMKGRGPSVVQIRAGDVSPSAIGLQVVAGLRQATTAIDEGALVTIDPGRLRITLLPISARSANMAE